MEIISNQFDPVGEVYLINAVQDGSTIKMWIDLVDYILLSNDELCDVLFLIYKEVVDLDENTSKFVCFQYGDKVVCVDIFMDIVKTINIDDIVVLEGDEFYEYVRNLNSLRKSE